MTYSPCLVLWSRRSYAVQRSCFWREHITGIWGGGLVGRGGGLVGQDTEPPLPPASLRGLFMDTYVHVSPLCLGNCFLKGGRQDVAHLCASEALYKAWEGLYITCRWGGRFLSEDVSHLCVRGSCSSASGRWSTRQKHLREDLLETHTRAHAPKTCLLD